MNKGVREGEEFTPLWEPFLGGAPKCGGPEQLWRGPQGCNPGTQKNWEPGGGGGAQNLALLFPSPASPFSLFFSLWGSSRGILVVFELRDPQMCIFFEKWSK